MTYLCARGQRTAHGSLGKVMLVAASLLVFCVLGLHSKAYAGTGVDVMQIDVGEELSVTAQVDEGGTLELQKAEVNGEAIALDSKTMESEEVLIALAAAHNGWYKANSGDWYYFVNGKWTVGWKKIDGYWYYFDNAGRMLKGWQLVSGSWYYLRTATNTPSTGPEGSMAVDWVYVGGYWYYLAGGDAGVGPSSPDYGKMVKGLRQIGTYTYYFYDKDENIAGLRGYPDGAMVKNKNAIQVYGPNGRIVYIDIDGEGHVRQRLIA